MAVLTPHVDGEQMTHSFGDGCDPPHEGPEVAVLNDPKAMAGIRRAMTEIASGDEGVPVSRVVALENQKDWFVALAGDLAKDNRERTERMAALVAALEAMVTAVGTEGCSIDCVHPLCMAIRSARAALREAGGVSVVPPHGALLPVCRW